VRKRGPRAVSQGVATQRLGPTSRLRVVDAILSVTHEPGSRHYELLRAFADEATLRRADRELEAGGYRTHEPGSRHYELLCAFADEATLRRADRELEAGGYRTHEFGDSVLVERRARGAACAPVWRRRATA